MIVDEASMVPTLVLDEMVRVAGVYGSKITLIGDFAQMGAPEAGGLLRDLAALPAAVELTAVRRFRQPWEADASLQLRARQPDDRRHLLAKGADRRVEHRHRVRRRRRGLVGRHRCRSPVAHRGRHRQRRRRRQHPLPTPPDRRRPARRPRRRRRRRMPHPHR